MAPVQNVGEKSKAKAEHFSKTNDIAQTRATAAHWSKQFRAEAVDAMASWRAFIINSKGAESPSTLEDRLMQLYHILQQQGTTELQTRLSLFLSVVENSLEDFTIAIVALEKIGIHLNGGETAEN